MQEGFFIRKHAGDAGAAFEFLIHLLQRVGGARPLLAMDYIPKNDRKSGLVRPVTNPEVTLKAAKRSKERFTVGPAHDGPAFSARHFQSFPRARFRVALRAEP